jgi:protein-disulfide isomerase
MTRNAMPKKRQPTLEPLDEAVDHVRGPSAGRLIVEYGDYECPYSRQAFHAIELVEQQLGGNVRFVFRHFPLTGIHPHALAAARAAEAAARQGRFWDMHELLFHRQKALEDGDLRRYAAQLGLDVAAFDRDWASAAVLGRIQRDIDSGLASGQVVGTPTLFIDGVVHRRGYDPPTLLAALAPAR